MALVLAAGAAAHPPAAATPIVFPVVGSAHYYDDFGEPRAQGKHEGIDILAPRKAIAVAAEAGTVTFWTTSASAGCMLYLHGASGTTYLYIHLNNDLGSGNDNRGSCVAGVAYAPGLKDGAHVAAGQPIGFVGDSGDANGIHPHLHFEVHPDDGAATDPFPFLNAARHLLFAAAPGATVTLSLTGVVEANSAGSVTLRLSGVSVAPAGAGCTLGGQPITLAVPAGVSTPEAGMAGARVVVSTQPLKTTLSAQLGKGLTAASVGLVVS